MNIHEHARKVISLEKSPDPDWNEIKEMCDEIIVFINEHGLCDEVDNKIYQFFEDYDVREKDQKYGGWQRDEVERLLDSRAGEMSID